MDRTAGVLVKRVVDFMRQRSHVDAQDPSMLTAREAQVAALLQQGTSNADIAAAMGISVRTAETHVAKVLRKSGVRDRHELAAISSAARRATVQPRRQRRTPVAPAARAVTARQRQIWALVAEGLSNEDIAVRVGVGSRTVETHIAKLRGKLGARNRTELAGRFTDPASKPPVSTRSNVPHSEPPPSPASSPPPS